MGKSWGISPKVSHRLYTSVVRPVLTYGCIVWWKALEKSKHFKSFSSVQRSACIGMTGALRTTPTTGLEMLLDLLPIDLHVKSVAMKCAARLTSIGRFKGQQYGHGKIGYLIGDRVNHGESDYILEKSVFDHKFSCQINDRDDWMRNQVISTDDLNIYTDGFKMDCGAGAGIYSTDIGIAESIKLHDKNTVFQAEIVGILKAAELIKDRSVCNKNISIYTDSQAALIRHYRGRNSALS